MYVRCEMCRRMYDDAEQWTICPHSPLDCRVDDLCPRCDTLESRHGACRHQIAAAIDHTAYSDLPPIYWQEVPFIGGGRYPQWLVEVPHGRLVTPAMLQGIHPGYRYEAVADDRVLSPEFEILPHPALPKLGEEYGYISFTPIMGAMLDEWYVPPGHPSCRCALVSRWPSRLYYAVEWVVAIGLMGLVLAVLWFLLRG